MSPKAPIRRPCIRCGTGRVVLGKYFSNLKQVEVPAHTLHGSPVAVFVTSSYEPQPVGTGSGATGCVSPGG